MSQNVYKENIGIECEDIKIINSMCQLKSSDVYDLYGYKKNEREVYTVNFENGCSMDIVFVMPSEETSRPFVNAIVYDQNGCEIGYSETTKDYIDGDWNVEGSDGSLYIVDVLPIFEGVEADEYN